MERLSPRLLYEIIRQDSIEEPGPSPDKSAYFFRDYCRFSRHLFVCF